MKSLLAILFLLFTLESSSQTDDSELYDTARRIDPKSATLEDVIRSFTFREPKDSSMVFFSQYDKIKRTHIGIQNLGDVGMPYINQCFQAIGGSGFYTGFNPYGSYFFTTSDAKLHSARLPYTEFRFAQGKAGQRGMMNFEAMHTQNFGENMGLTIQYHSVSYDGFYNRQSISNKGLLGSFYFRSKNRRYMAIALYAWNKAQNNENGGMERSPDTDTFFRSLRPSVRVVEVMLNNARSVNKLSEVKYTHSYAILRRDSMNTLYIGHTFTQTKQSNYYTDDAGDFGYYDSIFYYNNTVSTDSIACKTYSNSLEIYTPWREKGIAFKAGIQYDNFTYRGQAEDDNYFRYRNHNTSVYSAFNFNFLGVFNSQASGKLYIEGHNASDYHLDWVNKATLSESQRIKFIAEAGANSRHPGYQQVRQLSNHYVYQNNLENTRSSYLKAGVERGMKRPAKYDGYSYSLPKKQYGIYANYFLIDNYIYYNQRAEVAQGDKGQSCLQINASAHFNFKKLQLHQEIIYQTFSSQLGSQAQLPTWIGKGSYYFQTYAFKKATFMQIGFDAYWSSSYTARIYNPALMQFQQSSNSVGAYPFIDFFIHAEVRTARIFFKVEHLNADIPDEYAYANYMYVTPYYPASPRRFRLGFAWKFYY